MDINADDNDGNFIRDCLGGALEGFFRFREFVSIFGSLTLGD